MSIRNSGVLTSNTQNLKETNLDFRLLAEVLDKNGVILNITNEEPHVLKKEQALIVRDLELYFKNAQQSDKKDFINGLKELCKKQKHFRKALFPTQLEKSFGSDSTFKEKQESLIRMLLKISYVQKEVTEIILNEIGSIYSKRQDDNQDTSWLHTLLNPLRYLPYIKDGERLTTALLDVLETAPEPAQYEILDSIPEILPDNQYNKTAKKLCDLLDNHDEIYGAIIDCLSALNIDSEMRSEIQDRVLAKMALGTSLKLFPILLQYLLTDFKSQSLVPTLIRIRNTLDSLMVSGATDKEKESCKVMIFNKLQVFAISPKIVGESWLNAISSIKVYSDHKPIDYLILIMLHYCDKSRRKVIELIFRKRVQAGLFKISLLEKMCEKYLIQQLLRDYFPSMVEIGCSLMRTSSDVNVIEFASTLLKSLFNHQYTEVIYRKELLDSLIILTGSSEQKTVSSVLKIITSLLFDSKDKLQKHIVLLMGLLDKLDSFTLNDLSDVFEILCSLICDENNLDSMSGFKDELLILIRKLLSSCQVGKSSLKQRGIVSAIAMAKHTALLSNEIKHSLSSSITSLSQLSGPAKEAANLLDLTYNCACTCPQLLGLYYDQLATIFRKTLQLDNHFMSWLHEDISSKFQNMFIVEDAPRDINDFQVSIQYCINSSEEAPSNMAVNIAGMVIGCETNNILLLSPHFRLFRLLSYRVFAGDLSSIDALLGMGVLLPKIGDIDDLDSHQVKQVVDCLFHCANWLREIISGFVTQKQRSVRIKILRRLQDLLDVEKLLYSYMDVVPEHKLPVSYFDPLSQIQKQLGQVKEAKPKNPRKKFKSAPAVHDADETVASTSAANTQKSAKSTKAASKKSSSTTQHFVNFRDMDTDLILLLKYSVKFEDDDTIPYTQTGTLNIEQLYFILQDYASKLKVINRAKVIDLSHLNVIIPSELITDSLRIMKYIDNDFRIIIKQINKLLEQTDGRHDLPEMFTEEVLSIKKCFGKILEIFYLVFSWPGFQHSANLDLLRDMLRSIRTNNDNSINSISELTIEFVQRLSGYIDQCLHLNHAVYLVKTMEALSNTMRTSNEETQKKIASACGKLLSKRWYNEKGNLDTGKDSNQNVDFLVKMYLHRANIKTLCGLIGKLQDQTPLLKTKEDCLHMLASIDKQNFHVFYLELCNALLNRVKTEVQALTNNEHLNLWKMTAITMQGLQAVAKTHETRAILSAFLKKSIGILKVFISHGLPILEIMLRSKTDDVVAIFKSMQTNTRFLHHLCCQSKITKDPSLVAHVPSFRLTLETLVYRVKAALVANNCSEAFWMGNLRNRDLHGEDIPSQSTIISEDNEEDQEKLPTDDESEEVLDESNEEDKGSSEVYD